MAKPTLQNFVWESPQERRWREGGRAAQHLQALRLATESQRWREGAAEASALLEAVEILARNEPDHAETYWLETGTAIAALIDALHPLLVINSKDPLPEPERSELCWLLCALLDQMLTTPAQRPPRLAGMHTHLLLYGGIYWRRRHEGEGHGLERARHLFGRARHRLDPLPDWLLQTCEQFDAVDIPDPCPPPVDRASQDAALDPARGSAAEPPPAPGQQPEAGTLPAAPTPIGGSASAHAARPPIVLPPSPIIPPEQLAAELGPWLDAAGGDRAARLGLVCAPGAPLLELGDGRIDLNIAAFLEVSPPVAPDAWFATLAACLHGALTSGRLGPLELLEPVSGLYASLVPFWKLGGRVPPGHLRRLPAVLEAWTRQLDPEPLPAVQGPRRLPTDGPSPGESAERLLVQLDPLELAALAVSEPESDATAGELDRALEMALSRLRRDHLHQAFWQAPARLQAGAEGQPLEALRLLHRDGGFYAAAVQGLSCFRCWRQGSLACLDRARLTGADRSLPPSDLLLMAQGVVLRSGHLPDLQPEPSLLDLLESLAGREVVYVGWASTMVLEQHRSGRAFRLFRDRSMDPYGLRCVPMPDSRHPRRPHGGFRESLEQLVEAISREHAARPIDLLLVDQGAYRLPLLDQIERRHGISAVAPGPGLPQLFGLDSRSQPRWREPYRQPENWRDVVQRA
ncbi:MAG: hypothetical protein ACKO0M_17870 [Cyanobium sp.]